jgi:hypothetical protein
MLGHCWHQVQSIYGYPLTRLVDLHEIWRRGNAIQGDLEAIIFNPIASTILKWLRFKLVM